MLKYVHYLHIPTYRWTLFSGRHTLSHAPHHTCEGFTYVSRRVSRKSPPFIYQHHHHAGSGRPVSSWDAIQSLILSTVEQRFCFADKMLSSGEVLLLRGLPVSQDFAYLLLWTFSSTSQGAAVHGRWNPRRTHSAVSRRHQARQGEKDSSMDTAGPFWVVGPTDFVPGNTINGIS